MRERWVSGQLTTLTRLSLYISPPSPWTLGAGAHTLYFDPLQGAAPPFGPFVTKRFVQTPNLSYHGDSYDAIDLLIPETDFDFIQEIEEFAFSSPGLTRFGGWATFHSKFAKKIIVTLGTNEAIQISRNMQRMCIQKNGVNMRRWKLNLVVKVSHWIDLQQQKWLRQGGIIWI